MLDLERYHQRALRYLAHRGVPVDVREDLAQEICVLVLEHQGTYLNLAHLAGQAHDRLEPRCRRGRWQSLPPGLVAPEAPGDPVARIWLMRHLGGMDARTQHILAWYFGDDTPMHVLGTRLGLGESRISQLLTQALERLRHRIGLAETPPLPRRPPIRFPTLDAMAPALYQWRQEGWTQREMAARVGCSQTTILRWFQHHEQAAAD